MTFHHHPRGWEGQMGMESVRKTGRDKTVFEADVTSDKAQPLGEAMVRIPREGGRAQKKPLRGHPQAADCRRAGIGPRNSHLARAVFGGRRESLSLLNPAWAVKLQPPELSAGSVWSLGGTC